MRNLCERVHHFPLSHCRKETSATEPDSDWPQGRFSAYDRDSVMNSTSEVSICHYRLSRAEYDRAVEGGAFEPDAQLELIDGELLAMTPEGSRHAAVIQLVAAGLRQVFDSGFDVRVQHPLAADDYSEPEPDVAVVPGAIRDYMDAHPTSAVLVVEVSNESLHRDRTVKQRLYAASGIPEYWIVALPDHRLEVYRDPAEDSYHTVSQHPAGDRIAPLARPGREILVDDLLP